MISEIIPTNPNSMIGKLLVSVSMVSDRYVYKKVIIRKLKDDIKWFIDNRVYTIGEIILGVNSEIDYIYNNRLYCNDYVKVLNILLEILAETYTSAEYPEYYI